MNLYDKIAEVCAMPHGWTSFDKGLAMASAVIALRPAVSVEIGVYAGKGLCCLGLAHRQIGTGIAIGIDPYSAACSVEGQVNPQDKEWWAKVDHGFIQQTCRDTIANLGIGVFAKLVVARSDEADVPESIGVLRVDGNHGEMAIKDVQRFCPSVVAGGILFLDDVNWSGAAVTTALESLLREQWKLLYALDDGVVLQKK